MSVMTETKAAAAPVVDRAAIEAFLYREARFQDEHRYDEWEALWDAKALYWVPIDPDADPATRVSYIYDNRARIASRIRQLKTGRRHSQAPQSGLRRVISNLEIVSVDETIEVEANFILVESRRGVMVTWAGRTEYSLKPSGDSFLMTRKKVVLVNSGEAIPNLAFLI
ncbi:MAG: hypothetical protein JWO33_103 [Caulobacteraceae bacterium]|nr:hypothetical protein [Caulobacteraceae bacterium]